MAAVTAAERVWPLDRWPAGPVGAIAVVTAVGGHSGCIPCGVGPRSRASGPGGGVSAVEVKRGNRRAVVHLLDDWPATSTLLAAYRHIAAIT